MAKRSIWRGCRWASSSATDGVEASGNRAEGEHNVFTDFDDLARGAAAAGASSAEIRPTAAGIVSALAQGKAVIVSGTFAGKSPLPWTGDCGSDNSTAPGGATSHIIEVSSYNTATGMFTINDPARTSASQVSADALESFMSGNAGALAIWR
jgi:hypothetical protein